MTNCALFSTTVQVRILNDRGLVLHSSKTLEISVRPNTTDQPLTGTTSVFFNSSLGFAVFTNLAFMKPQRLVKLIFQCEGCLDSGGAKLAIGQESVPFKITPAFERLAYVQPGPSANPFVHPIVAGEVSGPYRIGVALLVFIPVLSRSAHFAMSCITLPLGKPYTGHVGLSNHGTLFQLHVATFVLLCGQGVRGVSGLERNIRVRMFARILGLSLHSNFSAVILGDFFGSYLLFGLVGYLHFYSTACMSWTTLWILQLSLSNMVDRAYMNTDLHSLYGLLNGQVPCRLLRSE